MITAILKQWNKQEVRKWYESYWLFDLHGTIIKPNHIHGDYTVEYYPFAKEALQLITQRTDIRTIVFTSSFPDEIEAYKKQFKKDGIKFKYFNENPEITNENGMFGYYKYKPYFDLMFEDKAGFEPEVEWKAIYYLFKNPPFLPDLNWKNPKLP